MTPDKLLKRWKCPPERFRVSEVNRGFKLCASYPEEVIVPNSVSDADIVKVRQLALFPGLPSLWYCSVGNFPTLYCEREAWERG